MLKNVESPQKKQEQPVLSEKKVKTIDFSCFAEIQVNRLKWFYSLCKREILMMPCSIHFLLNLSAKLR